MVMDRKKGIAYKLTLMEAADAMLAKVAKERRPVKCILKFGRAVKSVA
jgi:hypothetical protein